MSLMDDDTRQRFREQDSYLQVLISLAEDGAKLPVTLLIGGMLVTGNLISLQEYREGVEKVLFEAIEASGEGLEEREAVKEAFSLRRQLYEDIEEGDKYVRDIEEGKPLPPSPYKYVYLKNARFYSPSGQPWTQPEGFLWRGKASAVDGLVVGTFSTVPS
jgi:hypothetical protein